MRAAILCPGPSLDVTWPNDGWQFDLVIAVNRAALTHRCDWWAFCDGEKFGKWMAGMKKRPPRIVASSNAVSLIEKKGFNDLFRKFEHRVFEGIFDRVPTSLCWPVYSATAAAAFAFSEGARRIDFYGADMEGVEDFDGATDPTNNRTAQRWQHERENWAKLLPWLEQRGCTVTRTSPYLERA